MNEAQRAAGTSESEQATPQPQPEPTQNRQEADNPCGSLCPGRRSPRVRYTRRPGAAER